MRFARRGVISRESPRAVCEKSRVHVSTLLFALLLPIHGIAQEFMATIDKVIDGDTVAVVTDDGKSFRIRLSDIDAPERDQPWGMEATEALSQMGLRENARVRVEDTDRYGRLVATIFVSGINLNKAMVRNGHAWVYREYLRDQSLPDLEETARTTGKGLWANTGAIAPSRWRRGDRRVPSQLTPASPRVPPVKKSRSNICHVAGSEYYARTKHFVPFQLLSECLATGGRLPKSG